MADNRFVEVYSQSGFIAPSVKILVDKKTGVNYMFTASGYSGGLTALLNRDGTPVVTPIPNQYEK